jgi:hypothetical protein
MNPSLRDLEEVISIRQQIDALEKSLSAILGGSRVKPKALQAAKRFLARHEKLLARKLGENDPRVLALQAAKRNTGKSSLTISAKPDGVGAVFQR